LSINRKILVGLFIALGVLVTIVIFKTLGFQSSQIKVKPVRHTKFNEESIQRLSKIIQFKTITFQDKNKLDSAEFVNFHKYLEKAYPLVHKYLDRTKIGGLSLLYTWKGSRLDLKPIMLMSHQDVVPIDSSSIHQWKEEPFSGILSKGYLYGRGTLDVKSGIASQLEAVEHLLKIGYKPIRTILLAYGHDEEIGGSNGAKQIANYLHTKKVKLEYVLDEGGSIVSDVIPGIKRPVALIGIAEKGYLSMELSVTQKGGHSSMPPKESAIGILSNAVSKLEANPFPTCLNGVGSLLYSYLAPEMGLVEKIAFANKWMFSYLIKKKLEENDATRATLHTTIACSIINAGEKDNVLPSQAKAIINFRILPGDNVNSVRKYVEEVIKDKRISIKSINSSSYNPSNVSNINSDGYKIIHKTIAQIFPNTVVAPYLVLGSTDSRHYQILTKNIYRFIPLRFKQNDLSRVHGINERIAVSNYFESINFYMQLIQNSSYI
jgi:carboxypeptidase PM20D1